MANTKTTRAGFTPGPCTVQDNTDIPRDGHQLRVDSDSGAVAICGIKEGSFNPGQEPEMLANARLIATAFNAATEARRLR